MRFSIFRGSTIPRKNLSSLSSSPSSSSSSLKRYVVPPASMRQNLPQIKDKATTSSPQEMMKPEAMENTR